MTPKWPCSARSKVRHTCSTNTHESRISLHFALPLAFSKIFTSFHLPIDKNVKFQSFFFNFQISNLQEVTIVSTVTGNRYKKFGWKNNKFTRSSDAKMYFQKNHKCTKWPQNDLEYYKGKVIPYMFQWYPWVPNFTPFRSSISHLQGICKFSHLPIGHNGRIFQAISILFKFLKIWNFKVPKSNFHMDYQKELFGWKRILSVEEAALTLKIICSEK